MMTTACSLPSAASPSKTPSKAAQAPLWLRQVMAVAAVYNVVWGGLAVLFPLAFFRLFGMAAPNYPELWQCIGMIVGVYGVGYAVAALNPYRHWPVVLVGLMGKVFGPIGFAFALYKGTFPPAFGINILFNDLIWWVPFYLVLKGAYEAWLNESGAPPVSLTQALAVVKTQDGQDLTELSGQQPLLLVFLRHAGCTFCKETLAQLATDRSAVEAAGLRPVLVHMGTPEQGEAMAQTYGLQDLALVSDPDRVLFRAADLRRGRLGQVLGLEVWIRGYEAGIQNGHGVGALQGDGFQLSGYAILKAGQWVVRHGHATAAERTPFTRIAEEFSM
jgi:peroxiredoxin